ncbi:MAG: penicillin-binding protein 1C [Bacteroidales bacterium]|nr:penicillin-binding protein 1C [Bacteroidales bacterium]MDY0285397.1 penicillin-binding protein 1C [Bacteroidales bacterium]
MGEGNALIVKRKGCKKAAVWTAGFGFGVLLFLILVPVVRFDDPYCTVVEASDGRLLGAHISADGQWRFPAPDSLPEAFVQSITAFEDRYFFLHPGINPVSLVRAAVKNFQAGTIVQGGSTLTMQVVRLSRKGKARTYGEKLIEMVLALRLELACSKNEILLLYAAHAPFGGNVVGLEAASWRYFSRPPHRLSLAECAMLAVLPNAPSAIHPAKNRDVLKSKRDQLLQNLYTAKQMSENTFSLALEEPLPAAPQPLPALAPVLTAQLSLTYPGQRLRTTIDADLQESVRNLMTRHLSVLEANKIHNLSALVLESGTGKVRVYVGNCCRRDHPEFSPDVDLVQALRSTGSILKPFLYAAMLDDGKLLPGMLVEDIPSNFGGFTPKNYTENYSGMVPAWQALAQSLNVPAVRMLAEYDVARFYDLLQRSGITSLNFPPSHYGLSLILGGAEASLWEITSVYGAMASALLHQNTMLTTASLFVVQDVERKQKNLPFSQGAIFCTFEAMKKVHRPETEAGWENYGSSQEIAWKTGTSFGFRDGWAVGVTPDCVAGVWVGNADGEGRPGLTGASCAAPVLFDLFQFFPADKKFQMPESEMIRIPVCRQSGYPVSRFCPDTLWEWIPSCGADTKPCPFHQLIHLDQERHYRVNTGCYPADKIVTVPFFVLPPVQAWYYNKFNAGYALLPPFHPRCLGSEEENPLNFIYPSSNRTVYLPKKLNSGRSQLVMEAAHRDPEAILYWYLDDAFLGTTRYFHTQSCSPAPGSHRITITDGSGNDKSILINVTDKP